jgi:hypothetical protein
MNELLYSLTDASGTALSRPGVVDAFEATFHYDDIYNMTLNRISVLLDIPGLSQ